MRPELGPPFSPGWRGAPPGMLAPDVPAWWGFLARYDLGIQVIHYNVRVGQGTPVPSGADDFMRDQLNALTRERVDAVGRAPLVTYLIEVNADAGVRSIGQAILYRQMWLEDPPPGWPPAVAAIVTVVLRNDIIAVAAANNIALYPVGPDDVPRMV